MGLTLNTNIECSTWVRDDFLNGNGDNQDVIYCNEVQVHDTYYIRFLKSKGFEPKTIVDFGGQIGTFSLMCRKYWPDARIVAVEPIPEQVEVFKKNLPDVEICNKAIIGFLGSKEASPHCFNNCLETQIRKKKSSFPCLSISDFLKTYKIDKIDFLKSDIEGSEINVLREFGKTNFYENIDVIHGEWHSPEGIFEVVNQLTPHYFLVGRMAIDKVAAGSFYATKERKFIVPI